MNRYAGFWKRAGAFALDYIIILLYLLILGLIGFLINSLGGTFSWLFADRIRAQLSGFLLITLPVTLYFALGESSPQRATWGKKRLGLQVTDYDAERISVWRSLVRTTLKFIPWEIAHTFVWTVAFSPADTPAWVNVSIILVYALIGLNLAFLIFTKKHQTIYDLLAKTCVIKRSRV
jgi:uncharacterized RDD family membrane protein YckC